MIVPDELNSAPTAQTGDTEGEQGSEELTWIQLAQHAYEASTSFVDANYRKTWEDSIRAFNGQHATDSKYNQPSYDKRSKIFRPRIRSIIRKNEAAAAAAFFSNMDVVSVDPQDQSDKSDVASADIMKELLQYRLTKSVPWYQVVLGGLQDAQTVGAACAHTYWDYKEADKITQEDVSVEPIGSMTVKPENEEYPTQGTLPGDTLVANENGGLDSGSVRVDAYRAEVTAKVEKVPVVDQPRVDLIPLENVRFDPGASWIDPVNSSPYFIHLMPMYIVDVKAKMEAGEWRTVSDQILASAVDNKIDTTRVARNRGNDPRGIDNAVGDYDTVWIQRHIHRKSNEDFEFYTLFSGKQTLLTDPEPLKKRVLHGIRPYVIGVCVLETHRSLPSSLPTLSRGLIDETNEIVNQRLDNVKFVLNKKYLVKRGKEADIGGLVRNVPGGVVMLDDPNNDVRELSWQDVTASAFQEQQSINQELDELLGNFNPAALMSAGHGNSPARNMAMLSQSTGTLVEYLLRTYVETFVQPILRHLMKLEQAYETDLVILKVASQRAQLFQKFGIDEVTDDMLNKELTLTVNVGMGATDPMSKLQKFLVAMQQYTTMLQSPVQGLDMHEVGKEIFGHLGYSDGQRFFGNNNPQVLMLQQKLQQAQQIINDLQQKVKDRTLTNQVKRINAQEANQTKLQTTAMQEDAANKRALATHLRAIQEGMASREHSTNIAAFTGRT